MKKTGIVLLLAVVTQLISIGTKEVFAIHKYAQTVTVAKGGTIEDYNTITAALSFITDASATKPYVIRVMPGVYNEAITMKSWVDIEGTGWDAVKITSIAGPTVKAAGTTSNTSISNLTIEITPGAAESTNRAVNTLDTASLVVRNCRIISNLNNGGIGVRTDNFSTLKVYQCSIEGLLFGALLGEVGDNASSTLDIQKTNFDNIGANLVRVYGGGKVLLTHNTFGKYNQAGLCPPNVDCFYNKGIIFYAGVATIHSAYNKAKEGHLYNVSFRNSVDTNGALMFSTYDSHLTEVTVPSSPGLTGNFIDFSDSFNYYFAVPTTEVPNIKIGDPVYMKTFSPAVGGTTAAMFRSKASVQNTMPAVAVLLYLTNDAPGTGYIDGELYNVYSGAFFKRSGVCFEPTAFGNEGPKYVSNNGGLSATPGDIAQRVGLAGFGYPQRFFVEVNPTTPGITEGGLYVKNGDIDSINLQVRPGPGGSGSSDYAIRNPSGDVVARFGWVGVASHLVGDSQVGDVVLSAVQGGALDLVTSPDFGYNQATRIKVTNSGNVGIGTITPANILTIQQNSATDPIADAWTVYSSGRWKENIQPVQDALPKVLQLQSVYFDWKGNGKHDLGMIAEEVGKVVPEAVTYEENKKDARGLDYARLTALLTEAIKEQQAQIETLRTTIEELKNKN